MPRIVYGLKIGYYLLLPPAVESYKFQSTLFIVDNNLLTVFRCRRFKNQTGSYKSVSTSNLSDYNRVLLFLIIRQ